ncbi:RNA polymerase sigma factor [Fibrella sp. WM1]|uniref:RNA polymerase sigma factor n=1 Tax=Fibrella musci TaxID=3242485 RepID=UPI0035224FE7
MCVSSTSRQSLTDELLIQTYFTTRPSYCFEQLYKRYQQKVYRRCLSMTRDADTAQDYTQDIFIRMFSRLDRFQGRSSFSTWLYSIAYNYVLDQLRLSKRLPTGQLDEAYDYPGFRSDDSAELLETSLQQLGKALGSISSQDASILRLKYQDGLDVRQIGSQLNIQESAVKMRLKRSRDRVKRLCEVAY